MSSEVVTLLDDPLGLLFCASSASVHQHCSTGHETSVFESVPCTGIKELEEG